MTRDRRGPAQDISMLLMELFSFYISFASSTDSFASLVSFFF